MFQLNAGQQFIVKKALDWYYNSTDQVFQYDGPPGSGKSVVLNEIVNKLGFDPLIDVAAMSFIGSASLVMRMKGLANAKTAHSWLYQVKPEPMRDENGVIIMDALLNVPIMIPKFIPVDFLPESIKLIIIDEGFSMPRSIRPEIEKFGIKILVCGDQNQLPPVNDYPAFLADGPIYHLTECMRQIGREDINMLANRVNSGLPLLNGFYGNSLVIDADELTEEMLVWADAVICGQNKTRDIVNNRIRSILGYHGDLPKYGEKVVCRKNNWLESVKCDNGYEINLVNGLIGTVCNNPDVSSYDGKLFSLDFCPDLAPQAVFKGSRVNYRHMISGNDERIKIRNNRYQVGNMFEFAYAITAHIAQGSQFHRVVYLEEYMPREIQTNINLVGASRADTALIYVKNFDRDKFYKLWR